MSKSNVVSHLKQKKINEVLSTGKRMDGRSLEEYRPLIIKSDILAKSEGSAEVWLGKTHFNGWCKSRYRNTFRRHT